MNERTDGPFPWVTVPRRDPLIKVKAPKFLGPLCRHCGNVKAKKVEVEFNDGSVGKYHRGLIMFGDGWTDPDTGNRVAKRYYNCGLVEVCHDYPGEFEEQSPCKTRRKK